MNLSQISFSPSKHAATCQGPDMKVDKLKLHWLCNNNNCMDLFNALFVQY